MFLRQQTLPWESQNLLTVEVLKKVFLKSHH